MHRQPSFGKVFLLLEAQCDMRPYAAPIAEVGGRWKVEQLAKNKPAVAFWRKVIGEYCGGDFQQRVGQSEWGPLNVVLFNSDGRVKR